MVLVPPPWFTVGDVTSGLGSLSSQMLSAGDRRSVFVQAYILITREIQRRLLAGGFFQDPDWVARYVVQFAELYRQALAAYEGGASEQVPEAWSLSFEAAKSDSILLLQHLLLGINAHINNDLPNALYGIGIDPDRASRKRDHDAINLALQAATDPVKARLFDLYAPALRALEKPVGLFDDEVTNFSFEEAREAAWDAGVSLANAKDDDERGRIRQRIAAAAAAVGSLIRSPSLVFPTLLHDLAALERLSLPSWSDWLKIA
jgi:hypothetical protein